MKLIFLILTLVLTNYSSTYASDDDIFFNGTDSGAKIIFDPLEDVNRKVYSLNSGLFSDVVKIKSKINKSPKKRMLLKADIAIINFFHNLQQPITAINHIISAEPDKALNSIWRFFINSTIGLLGIFDMATLFNMEKTCASFSQTFGGKYKISEGVYIMLPIFGGYSLREFTTDILDMFFNPLFYMFPYSTALLVFNTYKIYSALKYIDYSELIMDNGLDNYIKIRSIYGQNANNLCY